MIAAAHDLHDPVLEARAQLVRASLEQRLGAATAEDSLHQAAWLAEDAHDDEVRARAWLKIASLLGTVDRRFAEARRELGEAGRLVAGLDRPELRLEWLNIGGGVLVFAGKRKDGRAKLEAALALARRL